MLESSGCMKILARRDCRSCRLHPSKLTPAGFQEGDASVEGGRSSASRSIVISNGREIRASSRVTSRSAHCSGSSSASGPSCEQPRRPRGAARAIAKRGRMPYIDFKPAQTQSPDAEPGRVAGRRCARYRMRCRGEARDSAPGAAPAVRRPCGSIPPQKSAR